MVSVWVLLSLDRTNCSFGKTQFNILMLGIVHQGIAFPILWTMLNQRGNSNSDERMDLLERFEVLFPDAQIAYLTADREFLGKEWLSYLLIDKPIPFRKRTSQSDQICAGCGQRAIAGRQILANLSVGETRILSGRHARLGSPGLRDWHPTTADAKR